MPSAGTAENFARLTDTETDAERPSYHFSRRELCAIAVQLMSRASWRLLDLQEDICDGQRNEVYNKVATNLLV